MAEDTPSRRMELTGIADVLGTFADMFLVASDAKAGITSLYFFQRHLSVDSAIEGTTGLDQSLKGKCVARIILSERSTEKLLQALAENRGVTLPPKTKEQE